MLALLGAACAKESNGGATPEKPVRGGTLVVGIDEFGGQLNPAITSLGSVVRATMLVYQGLLYLDAKSEVHPELAESFEVDDGGKTYRFTLRSGVKWHDGKPFSSADVKFTFEKVLLQYHPRTRVALGAKIEAIETPDPQTVVFRLKEPFSAFPLVLTVADAAILPQHIYDGTDPLTNPANDQPVGTGPFKFESLIPDSELRLTRNPDFYLEGRPYLDSVVYRVIPETSTLLQALEEGDIDAVVDLPASPDVERLKRNSAFRVVASPADPGSGNCSIMTGFNLDRPALKDVELRRGLAYALDANRMLKEALFGFGRVSDAPIVRGISWAHAKVEDYPSFDRKRAEDLIKQAGWISEEGGRVAKGVVGVADGTRLRFEIFTTESSAKLAEIMREQFGDVGVELVVASVEQDLLTTRVFRERNFDLYITIQCQRSDPEIGLRRIIHSSGILPIMSTNGAGYRNSELDQLVDRAASEIDRGKRADLYREVEDILVRDLPYMWLVEIDKIRAHTTSCSGMDLETVHFAQSAYCVPTNP